MKYILGGGLAGLIYAFYDKDYEIITPEIGGQISTSFNLGPRYLHDTEYSRLFLHDLGIQTKKSKIKIGYMSDEGWINPDENFRKLYYMKSRNISNLDGFDSTVMNSNKSEIDILLVDFKDIIKQLTLSVHSSRFIFDKVKKVDTINKIIELEKRNIKYKHIISTMPIKYLNIVPAFDIDFIGEDMNYILTDQLEDLKDYNYVYDIRTTTPFHRITVEKDKFVLDINDISKFNGYIIESRTLKNAQIISTDKVSNTHDIKFSGRYGTWNRKWKTENIIEDAIEQRNMGQSTFI